MESRYLPRYLYLDGNTNELILADTEEDVEYILLKSLGAVYVPSDISRVMIDHKLMSVVPCHSLEEAVCKLAVKCLWEEIMTPACKIAKGEYYYDT